MSQPNLFSCGLELKTLVTSPTLLRRSWAVIGDLYRGVDSSSLSVEYKVHKESDLTIIAFVANQQFLEADLVSSSDLTIPHFNFLCTKSNPSFSVNKSAIELFSSLAQPHNDKLNWLRSQIDSSTPLIVTGHAFGGSIASLFTLWLLDTIGSGKKRPLCITFGSPLIGDQKLQQAISKSSTWNSCFLHLAYYRDPLPRAFIPHSNYKPFGTFLLCSEYGASCFENSGSILEVLRIMGSNVGNVSQGFQGDHYREIVEDLNCKALCKDLTTRVDNFIYSNPLKMSIVVQLQALGLVQMQQQQQNIDINRLVEMMGRAYIRRKKFNPSEKLNHMKINMANLEWYKKKSKECGIGYYDAFKNERSTWDHDVVMYKKTLTLYWKDMIEEAEMKPQKEGAAFRTRWLFAGTNYRRMVEPLDIAEYYKKGGKDYKARERSNHYIQLENWLEEDRIVSGSLNSSKKQNVESILTLDSCFWARVEEALLLCKALESGGNDEARTELVEFEKYVFRLLKDYSVSPEIFLEDSSYMCWWREYKGIAGDSALANFMRNPSNYKQYAEGAYDFY